MKNIKYIIALVLGVVFFTACEKDEIESTAAVSMAGEWYVTGDAIDADGNIVYQDVFGLGHFHLDTYNDSKNSTNEMWINDNGTFWDFRNKISINLDNLTFEANQVPNDAYEVDIDIRDGKILYGAATTPSGTAADSIVFIINFSDDTYPEAYGFDAYRIAGFRYTGLAGDEDH